MLFNRLIYFFFTYKIINFCSYHFNDAKNQAIFDEAEKCIQFKLCSLLGNIKEKDFHKVTDHDFGKNSAVYKAFGENYPQLYIPKAENQHQSGNAQVSNKNI